MSTAQRPAHKALSRPGTFGTANPIVVHRPSSAYPREELQRWGLEGLTQSHGSVAIDPTAEKECGFLMFEALPEPSNPLCACCPLQTTGHLRLESEMELLCGIKRETSLSPVRQNNPSAHCRQG